MNDLGKSIEDYKINRNYILLNFSKRAILNRLSKSLTLDRCNTVLGASAILPIVKYPSFIESVLPYFWDDTKFTAKRLDLILEQCRMKQVSDGLLVIDDTLARKTGKQIEATVEIRSMTIFAKV